jgi:Na+-driven multidrug efflux pump
MYIFADPLISIFTSDAYVASIAKFRLAYMYISFATGFIMDNVSSALRGFGYAVAPTVISVLGVCVFRIIWLKTVFIKIREYWTILFVYPVSWVIVGVGVIALTVRVIRKLEKREAKM